MKRILLVDESVEVTRLYEKALGEAGFETKISRDGESAKKMLEAENFDIALIDIRLPGAISGFELLQYIRSNEKTRDMKVLILSGFADQEELRNKCKALGAECIAKGAISLAGLTEKVRQLVK